MNNNYLDSISIIIIGFKSTEKILKFIKSVPSNLKVIIIENSNDQTLKNKILNKYQNVEVHIKSNQGVSSALNFAVKKIKTKYFLQISPDINFDFKDLRIFKTEAEKLKDKFAALGPQFLNVKKESHKQSNPLIEVAPINFIHGSVMFMNTEIFNLLNGFDENFFLYFEETDYCKRAKKKGFQCYQINKIKVKNEGRSVEINKEEEKYISNILTWHFIWSKFYYYKKHYGFLLSIILFIPPFLRTLFRLLINYFIKNKTNYEKYKFRLNGLISSITGKKSSLRPNI
tara:strand:- start:49 stop:906 length:858 start_codon:yes stop_codon:yes gene_type:complete